MCYPYVHVGHVLDGIRRETAAALAARRNRYRVFGNELADRDRSTAP